MNCLRPQNAPEQVKALNSVLKLTAKPKVLENLKRSWKKSWEVIEFEELKRVRTLLNELGDLFIA